MLNFKKIFASTILLVFATFIFSMTFEPINVMSNSTYSKVETILAKNKQKTSSLAGLMSSTVRIHVTVSAVKLAPDGTPDQPITKEWTGSGVVYEKTNGKQGQVRSRILSANHVLKAPEIGSIEEEVVDIMGLQLPNGKSRVDSVKFELQTADNRTCALQVLTLGGDDLHDVAVAEADCDAGEVAELALEAPTMGAKVFIVGYPQGVKLPILTEGFVSGWSNGYLLTSASATGGNSGGPVFFNGKVVGLLVRVGASYSHHTLAVPLEECLMRIAQTPAL